MERFRSVEPCVDLALDRIRGPIRLAIPLGLGKPNHFVNALYRRVKADPRLSLEIYTALTLERPKGDNDLARRFLAPLVDRIFGNYPDLDYELDRVARRLPANVRVREFYFPAGKYTGNAAAQQDYISTNYTYVARDLADRGVNLVAQQVAVAERDGRERFSLSSNADVSLDLTGLLRARGAPLLCVAQRNDALPFMLGDADVDPSLFECFIDAPEQSHTLFAPPKTSVPDVDHMIGLHASTLIKDGGELQIGIGALGDALVSALLLRHRDNATYRRALDAFSVPARFADVITRLGQLGTFDRGLFAATEMLVDGFMHLFRAGILKRKVYDDLALSRLLHEGRIDERVTLGTLDALRAIGAVQRVLTTADVAYLVRFGILRKEIPFVADLDDPGARAKLEADCLGTQLRGGNVLHAGFFLGPTDFYEWLRNLSEEERRLISMRSVSRINQLYGHEAIDRLHRRDARFVNTAMMVTLGGAIVSDGLEDGTVVSGVGGQYNFVAMAHALPDGHSVIQIRSTRGSGDALRSNVVFNYGHTTIPRHQRDVLVTEYGIADLRGKTDAEVIARTLEVTDSRFQDALLAEAKRAGKIPADHRIADAFRANVPEVYTAKLAGFRREGLFAAFPFGTDLTAEEIVLGRCLERLRSTLASTRGAARVAARAALHGTPSDAVMPYLRRMGLEHPKTTRERLYQRLLAGELSREIG